MAQWILVCLAWYDIAEAWLWVAHGHPRIAACRLLFAVLAYIAADVIERRKERQP